MPIPPWRAVGPLPFTQVALGTQDNRRKNITALPSQWFHPNACGNGEYHSGGPVYAYHFWYIATGDDLKNRKKIKKIKERYADKKA